MGRHDALVWTHHRAALISGAVFGMDLLGWPCVDAGQHRNLCAFRNHDPMSSASMQRCAQRNCINFPFKVRVDAGRPRIQMSVYKSSQGLCRHRGGSHLVVCFPSSRVVLSACRPLTPSRERGIVPSQPHCSSVLSLSLFLSLSFHAADPLNTRRLVLLP